MKRKVLSIIFASMFAISLVGCGNEKEVKNETKTDVVTQETSKEEEVAVEPETKEDEVVETTEEKTTISEETVYESNVHYSIDLNNDGTVEDILYYTEKDPEYEEDMIGKFFINEIDCSDIINLYNPIDTYRIVDLDENDNFYEIAISTYGMSDDLETEFLRFDGESVVLLGNTEGIIGNGTPIDKEVNSITLNHDGTMQIYTRIDFPETTFVPMMYKIDNGQIVRTGEEEMFTYAVPREGLIKTTIPLTVHTEIASEDVVTLDAGTEFDCNKTDNKEWVNVIVDDTEYWLRITDSSLPDNDNAYTWEVFENLFLAD